MLIAWSSLGPIALEVRLSNKTFVAMGHRFLYMPRDRSYVPGLYLHTPFPISTIHESRMSRFFADDVAALTCTTTLLSL